MKPDTLVIKNTVNRIPEIAAAYLFGSASRGEPVINDIDVLILVHPGADREKAVWTAIEKISAQLNVAADVIDVLPFDLDLADPQVLYRAVDEGILLKNDAPGLLTAHIEALSLYFLENEYILKEAARLRQELIEEV